MLDRSWPIKPAKLSGEEDEVSITESLLDFVPDEIKIKNTDAVLKINEMENEFNKEKEYRKRRRWVFPAWVAASVCFYLALSIYKVPIYERNSAYYFLSLVFFCYGLKAVITSKATVYHRYAAHNGFVSLISPFLSFWEKTKIDEVAALIYGGLFLILGFFLFVMLIAVSS